MASIKPIAFIAVVLIAMACVASGGYSFGFIHGYDQGFELGSRGRLMPTDGAIDWTTPENQAAIRKAFPPAASSPTDEPR